MSRNSVTRYARLSERLTGKSYSPHPDLASDAADYAHGKIDVELAIDILRDPVDLRPENERKCFPCTEHSSGSWAVGNNHNVQSLVLVPEDFTFWLAAGWDDECENPVYNPFIGFDMDELLLGEHNPQGLPTYDPPYNGEYGNGVHEE
jgi:hypothetical protein